MKKIILPIMCMFGYYANAQITVNSSTVALSGKAAMSYTDTGSIAIQTGGNNITWDLSTLRKEFLDTTRFFDRSKYAELNKTSSFCNLIILGAENDGSWILLNKTTKSLDLVGFAEDTGGVEVAVNKFNDNILKFPLTNTSSYKDTTNNILDTRYLGVDPDGSGPAPELDSLRTSYLTYSNSNAKGWGKVKLTSLNLVDAIMLETVAISQPKYEVKSNGTWTPLSNLFAQLLQLPTDKDTTYEHKWWSDNINYGFPLINYSYYPGDTKAYDIEHLKGVLVNSSINDISASTILVYPNPANNIIYFKNVMNSNATLKLFNTNGQLILSSQLSDNGLNLENLSSGIYIIMLLDGNNMHQIKITKE